MWNTVHNGSTIRFRRAEEQAKISPVDVDEITEVIYEEFSEFIAKPIKHKITESQMSQMNYQVGIEGKKAEAVARDYLVKEGLLKK